MLCKDFVVTWDKADLTEKRKGEKSEKLRKKPFQIQWERNKMLAPILILWSLTQGFLHFVMFFLFFAWSRVVSKVLLLLRGFNNYVLVPVYYEAIKIYLCSTRVPKSLSPLSFSCPSYLDYFLGSLYIVLMSFLSLMGCNILIAGCLSITS